MNNSDFFGKKESKIFVYPIIYCVLRGNSDIFVCFYCKITTIQQKMHKKTMRQNFVVEELLQRYNFVELGFIKEDLYFRSK